MDQFLMIVDDWVVEVISAANLFAAGITADKLAKENNYKKWYLIPVAPMLK